MQATTYHPTPETLDDARSLRAVRAERDRLERELATALSDLERERSRRYQAQAECVRLGVELAREQPR